ncbi:hypothetical protein BA895_22785 [Humibacillus sp. DSM 29435]|uniref:TnsA-like heteromeric transposase endonuclease subunit n=1 Tax=Humibacillus sp. DSM 29435 TaxID=1869167 RepID=UPI000872975B|nr:TnsA-like heteromeric transposase endonuclease subunit [Humibacillus sp. DSM 29435]OFE15184.1 hypothetical protein BA895_22785 [Humibacillus sp. DSM 29435]
MRHYPGWWWSATTGDLVGHESLSERDRLMLADFDRDVVAIASQPFGITGDTGDSSRRHVPDYLLRLAAGAVVVVDVKLRRAGPEPLPGPALLPRRGPPGQVALAGRRR